MTKAARPSILCAYAIMAFVTALALSGCSNVPRYDVRMAEPDATLTRLTEHPEQYEGKVVLLGGTIIEEEADELYLWLRANNRPLDQDYVPHRPMNSDGAEAGSFWMIVEKEQLPSTYRDWARMTVVGRVMTGQRQTEPVLSIIYIRGWGMSGAQAGIWAHVDPRYIPSVPASVGVGAGANRP
jgi:starvation-inducible outer membrane lipoprotein